MSNPMHINLDNLNAISGGDPAFTLALLMKMQSSLPVTFEAMKNAMASGDWPSLKAAAHKAKSTFAYLDLQDMRQQLQDIEHQASEGGKVPELPGRVEKALKLGHEILAELGIIIVRLRQQ